MVYINRDADSALAELPPLPIGGLVVGVLELLEAASDLPQPRYVTVDETQAVGLQFGPDRSSYGAISRWAFRFGGMLVTEPHVDAKGARTYYALSFDYYGVEVKVYAIIAP